MAPASARLVHVRLWAAARAAAGQPDATVTVTTAEQGDPSVEEVRRAVLASLPDRPELPR